MVSNLAVLSYNLSRNWLVWNHAADREQGSQRASHRVLIVEDDYFVGLQNEQILQSAGFELVGVAGTTRVAIEIAERELPDIIVMDIHLALGGDGIDTAIDLLQRRGLRSVFVTAHSDPTTRRRAQPAQPLGWLTRPFAPDELVKVVTTRCNFDRSKRNTSETKARRHRALEPRRNRNRRGGHGLDRERTGEPRRLDSPAVPPPEGSGGAIVQLQQDRHRRQ